MVHRSRLKQSWSWGQFATPQALSHPEQLLAVFPPVPMSAFLSVMTNWAGKQSTTLSPNDRAIVQLIRGLCRVTLFHHVAVAGSATIVYAQGT